MDLYRHCIRVIMARGKKSFLVAVENFRAIHTKRLLHNMANALQSWSQLAPELEHNIATSAVGVRVSTLRALTRAVKNGEIPPDALDQVSALVLRTYDFYSDADSRRQALATIQEMAAKYPPLIDKYAAFIHNIAVPPKSIALTDLMTLLVWTNALSVVAMPAHLSEQLVVAQALLLDSIVGATHPALQLGKHNRRVYESALASVTTALAKSIGPHVSANTVRYYVETITKLLVHSSVALLYIGVLAAALQHLMPTVPAAWLYFEQAVPQVLQYLSTTVILGKHMPQAYSLQVFGEHFLARVHVSDDTFAEVMLPNIEKANLRSPELILGADVLSRVLAPLRGKVSGNVVVLSKVVTQLFTNMKSLKDEIRVGAANAFKVLLSGGFAMSDDMVASLVGDFFKNLKTASSVDQKSMIAGIIAELTPPSPQVVSSMLAFVAKDQNEVSLAANVHAMLRHFTAIADTIDASLYKLVVAQLEAGLQEKKLNLRRVWATEVGLSLYDTPLLPALTTLVERLSPHFLKSIEEALLTPLPVIASKGIATSYVGLSLLGQISHPDIASLLHQLVLDTNQPSILTSPKVYAKLAPFEAQWYIRSLTTASTLTSPSVDLAKAWVYFGISPNVEADLRRQVIDKLRQTQGFASSVVDALYDIVRYPDPQLLYNLSLIPAVMNQIVDEASAVDLIILANSLQISTKHGWLALCKHGHLNPAQVVATHHQEIITKCQAEPRDSPLYEASIKTLAMCANLQPDICCPLIASALIKLDISRLAKIEPEAIEIWHGQDEVLVIDPLNDAKKQRVVDKNVKDYELQKWEQDMRSELAKKGKAALQKKYTREEQLVINEQLAKEKLVRARVDQVVDQFVRSLDIVNALVRSNEAAASTTKHWFPVAVDQVLELLLTQQLLVDSALIQDTLINLSSLLTPRLGPIRQAIGVAILRIYNVAHVPERFLQEPLIALLSRILFRIKFLSDSNPLDPISLSYVLPLLKKVLANGKLVAIANASKQVVTSEFVEEDPEEEQLLLAMEIIGSHAEAMEDDIIPRTHILEELISLMKLPTRAKLAKECFISICQHIAANISKFDLALLFSALVTPETFVRGAILEALNAEFDLRESVVGFKFSPELWITVHDNDDQCNDLANDIWFNSGMDIPGQGFVITMLAFFSNADAGLRFSIAKAVLEGIRREIDDLPQALAELLNHFWAKEKPLEPIYDQYGLIIKLSQDQKDAWEDRSTVALIIKELNPLLPSELVVTIFEFLVKQKALGDREEVVRLELQEAGIDIIETHGAANLSDLIPIFETVLEDTKAAAPAKPTRSAAPVRGKPQAPVVSTASKVTESVVILYGALARHLDELDPRLAMVVKRLLKTLSTPSEDVQSSVSDCIAPLVPKFAHDKLAAFFEELIERLFTGTRCTTRLGAAYGIAGLVKGAGIQALNSFDILRTLTDAADDKKDAQRRQGVSLAFYCLSKMLGKFFEPYVVEVLPVILKSLGDQAPEVREATDLAARQIMKATTSFGVKQLIPLAIANLDEIQWRSKKGSVELLGSMAYLDPTQLSASLSTIVPEIVGVLNDTHKEVRKAADQALKRFGDVIRNPEIQSIVPTLLNAIGDPTKYTDEALDKLIKTQFVHYIDGSSLALIIHVIHRGMKDRSAATKKKACQIVGNMAFLVDLKDLQPYLSQLVSELEIAMVDPVPGTRSTAARAIGSLVEKLGEDQFPDLIPRLFDVLQDESRAGDRLGSAQALAEVVCGLGVSKLDELLSQILDGATSPKQHIRAGFMPLLLFLPVCFGSQFAPYLAKIIPPILHGLADTDEEIRDTALRAGRLIVKNYAKKAVDLLLPELEKGLSDESYRIRLSLVELTGDLLFQVTGITGKNELGEEGEENDSEDEEDNTLQSGEINRALTELLGQERRDRILSLLFICRSDVAGIVRSAAVDIWKALVSNTPRTVKEILPTLTQFIVVRLASPDEVQRNIAAQTLGDMVRRVGANALAQLLPTLEQSLYDAESDSKQGICVALTELVRSSQHDVLVDYQDVFVRCIREALTDPSPKVRAAAALTFEALQEELGKVVIDEILPHLLSLLQDTSSASSSYALLALREIMSSKSDVIFPILLPTLLSPPIDAFKATALALLASVAGPALYRRLGHVINTLLQAVIDSEARQESAEQQQLIKDAFDSVLLAIDSDEGLHPLMQQLLLLIKSEDASRRAVTYGRLEHFFTHTSLDYSVYTQDMVSQFIMSLGDRASPRVVEGTFAALNALVKQQSKESLERLVKPARQALALAGTKGEVLPGFALPRGPSCILPIFLHGLMYGNTEQKELSALGIAEVIEKTPPDNLKPFATTTTGPLIRVIGEKVTLDIKSAILEALTALLSKIPQFLRPFIPQLQRTFVRSLLDPKNDKLRTKAVAALGTLIEFQPRVDSLVTELVTGAKGAEAAVKTSILKAILEVVSKAGHNMSEASKTSIMTLVEEEISKVNDKLSVAYARLVGLLLRILLTEEATNILKTKILTAEDPKFAILSINSFLKDAPNHIFETGLIGEIVEFVVEQSQSTNSYITDNATVAMGKLLLLNGETKSPRASKGVAEAETPFVLAASLVDTLVGQLCQTMLQPASNSPDSRRLALVVVRTVARLKYDATIEPHVDTLAPLIFTCIRDPVIPIRLAAEKAWLAVFELVEDKDMGVFKAWFALRTLFANALGAPIQPRSIEDYTKRVAARLASVERERIEQGGDEETMFSDRFEDENEVWAVGGVDIVKS